MAAQYGLIGLGVMGENLVLNIEQHGFSVAIYNRTAARTEAFAQGGARGKQITPTYSIADFVAALERPRRIILLVSAGAPAGAGVGGRRPPPRAGGVLGRGGQPLFRR